jgi:hypothetical protein
MVPAERAVDEDRKGRKANKRNALKSWNNGFWNSESYRRCEVGRAPGVICRNVRGDGLLEK